MEKDIRWPEYNDEPFTYLGRNGYGKMVGIYMFTLGVAISIYPINSKQNEARCNMQIPKDKIPEVIKALQDLMGEVVSDGPARNNQRNDN